MAIPPYFRDANLSPMDRDGTRKGSCIQLRLLETHEAYPAISNDLTHILDPVIPRHGFPNGYICLSFSESILNQYHKQYAFAAPPSLSTTTVYVSYPPSRFLLGPKNGSMELWVLAYLQNSPGVLPHGMGLEDRFS
ncbi:hypothetical protein CIHG_01034 [Coccidioides immitis H538.4]|uniref:Uncharacterized protein n=3 Tax=Coccidioides immitis TaxID=5501 RepID=A0A0J8QQ90_COCIT|nr:hypothetical protein CIRG_03441 [Coccidioides immitis RMSCC 2394]KMU74719.1 hypothetical protein CISG_00649 [Coccidioides immitis RMSCC 3703]KMU83252.1 hypothetical protein CIHG_01034 [Coccidioides immitis H538.4]